MLVNDLLPELRLCQTCGMLKMPISTELAKGPELPYTAFIVAILFTASQSLVTPIAHLTKLMVFSPGFYCFFDMTGDNALLAIDRAAVMPWLICRQLGI